MIDNTPRWIKIGDALSQLLNVALLQRADAKLAEKVAAIIQLLGLSEAQVDDLFRAADQA